MSVRSDSVAGGYSADHAVSEPEAAYQSRLQEVAASIEVLEGRDRKFLRVRSILGVVSIGLGVLCIGRSDVVAWYWMLLPLAVFLIVLPFDRSCLTRLSHLRQVRGFHESRLRRLKRDFSGESVVGGEYDDESHPWIRDLDVFGRGSLFQLLNECRTKPGQKVLAGWMTTVPEASEIRVRQARAQGLKQALRLRESLACIPEAQGVGICRAIAEELGPRAGRADFPGDHSVVTADWSVIDCGAGADGAGSHAVSVVAGAGIVAAAGHYYDSPTDSANDWYHG